jgi:streptomycin 6-kinase
MPVRRGGHPAMLKAFKATSDEKNQAELLTYYAGDGAVRLIQADRDGLLMERATGSRSLRQMAIGGGDSEAAEILAHCVEKLHRPRFHSAPSHSQPLNIWFGSLFARRTESPILARCAEAAHSLLMEERDILPLHGDLHHENVIDSERGWLAIDPKGLIGERAYEIANLLGNPWPHGEIVHDVDRMRRLARLYADRLRLDEHRILAYALAHAGLAASWSIDDGDDPTYRLTCAEVLSKCILY